MREASSIGSENKINRQCATNQAVPSHLQIPTPMQNNYFRDANDKCYNRDEMSAGTGSILSQAYSSNCNCFSENISNHVGNVKGASDVVTREDGLDKTYYEEIEPIHKYNLLEVKPRKSRTEKHGQKDKLLNKDSGNQDPIAQEQLENLIFNVFTQLGADNELKQNKSNSNFNNACESYSPEFESFTSNKKESILRFPYMVNRISTKSSKPSKTCHCNNCIEPSFKKERDHRQHSNDNDESMRGQMSWVRNNDDKGKNSVQPPQIDCISLSNNLVNSIDKQLNSTPTCSNWEWGRVGYNSNLNQLDKKMSHNYPDQISLTRKSSMTCQCDSIESSFREQRDNEQNLNNSDGSAMSQKISWVGNDEHKNGCRNPVQSKNDCINLCNNFINSLDKQLFNCSTPKWQSEKDNYSLNSKKSENKMAHDQTSRLINNNGFNTTSSDKVSEEKLLDGRQCLKINSETSNSREQSGKVLGNFDCLKVAKKQSGVLANQSQHCMGVSLEDTLPNHNKNKGQSCTQINSSIKKKFLDSFFGFDKVREQQSLKTCDSNQVEPIEVENKFNYQPTLSPFPKMSVSDDNFSVDCRDCNFSNYNRRSKSKISDVSNFDKRPTSANQVVVPNQSTHQICMVGSKPPVNFNDFPSEVPSSVNRQNLESEKQNILLVGGENSKLNKNHVTNNTDFVNNTVRGMDDGEPIGRPTLMNDGTFGMIPELNFLLDRTSNSFSPSRSMVDQNVYFCDVTNNEKCNFQDFDSQKNNHNMSDSRETETFLNYENSNNNCSSFMGSETTSDNIENKKSTYKFSKTEKNCLKYQHQNYRYNGDSVSEYEMFNEQQHPVMIERSSQEELYGNRNVFSKTNRLCKLSDSCNGHASLTSVDQRCSNKCFESCSGNSKLFDTNIEQTSPSTFTKDSSMKNYVKSEPANVIEESVYHEHEDYVVNRMNTNYSMESPDLPEKRKPLCQIISLDEPEYLQHLKRLRWDHLQRISREVDRLESLERFLDSCGCGHIMAL